MNEAQRNMLEQFAAGEDGKDFDGRTAQSLFRKGYIAPKAKGGWKITSAGRKALKG